jgi:hypothetical protein
MDEPTSLPEGTEVELLPLDPLAAASAHRSRR